jgi:hypothetical protein
VIPEDPDELSAKAAIMQCERYPLTLRVPVLALNRPNLNGRVYPADAVRSALGKLREPLLIQESLPAPTVIGCCVGIAGNPTIDDGKLFFECQLLKAPFYDLLKNGKATLVTSGIGSMHLNAEGQNVIEEDYELQCLFLTSTPA